MKDILNPLVFGLMQYKGRDSGGVESRAVYSILDVNRDGKKDLIGIYLSENEGAKFWLSILIDLKQRVWEIFWLLVLTT